LLNREDTGNRVICDSNINNLQGYAEKGAVALAKRAD
jgi:hypothetical protein